MAISTQYQNLNLIPGKSAPVVVHCSQGNVGDTVGFYLYDGDKPFYPTNVGIAVHGVRADGSVFGPYTVAVTSDSNLVSFNIVTAMTSVSGAAIGELVLADSNQNQIGSANFGLLVEATPYSSSVTYEDDLSIYQRILAYVLASRSEIQSAISSEDAKLNTEISQRKTADSLLQSQIDQIVAPSGQAPSAAEVQNARIGVDGTTYDTLGNAIRGQFKNASDKMGLFDDVAREATANRWDSETVQNGLLHTNGQVYTGTTYDVYCYNDIGDVNQGDVVKSYKVNIGQSETIVSAENMQRVVAYDSSGNVVSSAGAVITSSYTVPAGVASLKVSITKAVSNDHYMVLVNEDTPTDYIPYSPAGVYYVSGEASMVPEVVYEYGEKQVTAKNCRFMVGSKNLIDPEKVLKDLFINQTNGEVGTADGHYVSGFIRVKPNSRYTFSAKDPMTLRYCWYDEHRKFINGVFYDGNTTSLYLVSPQRAVYFRCSIYGGFELHRLQFEEGGVATEYHPYDYGYLRPEYFPTTASGIYLNVPSKVYALVGYETNIYFENITEKWDRYSWNVDCPVGMQLERGFRITPSEEDVGSYTLSITADADGSTAYTSTTLVVVSASAGSGTNKKIIVLGDSTTNNGIAVTKLNTNFSSDQMNISTIGTRGTSPNKHEGRSGWTFSAYFNPPNEGDIALGVENPFYNPSSKTFDASYYFSNSGVAVPDWFFINLGINDVFSYQTDSDVKEKINEMISRCDNMISSIQNANSSIKIGLCLTIPPNHSQDAFGKAYKTGQTRDRYKRNNLLMVRYFIDKYDNREADGIYLIPINLCLDTVYNMGMETLPVNARNTSVTYESPILNGGVHPVESGYWQIADVYTAFLKGNV